MTTPAVAALVALVVLVVGLAGPAVAAEAAPRQEVEGDLTVFAASSLTEAFTRIGNDFERRHPGTTVTFSFNSSSTLKTQIEQGAPADVFASADETNMDELVDTGAVAGDPETFARNRLAIGVESDNPRAIRTLADTTKDGTILVLCAIEVPCGKYALEAYRNAGVDVPPDTPTAENAKATLSRVSLGEADAAVVYVTDVRAARGSVDSVRIPAADNVVAVYPIAALEESENPVAAKAFVRYVVSPAGQRTLGRFGFIVS